MTLVNRLQSFPALRAIRFMWLKQSYDLVGYKKLDVIDTTIDRNLVLDGTFIYKAKLQAEMRQGIDELRKRLVVQDHAYRHGSDSNDSDDESDGDDDSEEEE